jgi:kynureninase
MDWSREFPILASATYLNSCSLGALSRTAEGRVAEFLREWHALGAAAWYDRWLGRLDELRQRMARVLGARPTEVALAASTSAALSVIASALDYRGRNQVVVAELDFPTIAYQWLARRGVDVVRIASPDGATVPLEHWAAAVGERTAAIATSHVFYNSGAIQDLPALAHIAHDAGALLIIDAYQSAGQIPLHAAESGADVLIAGPLKWLLGGPGLAYLYVREELGRRLEPDIAGWFGVENAFDFDSHELRRHPDARRFELGTPALAAVHAALGALDIIESVGIDAIRARNRVLTDRLLDGCAAAGLAVTVAPRPEERSAIVMIGHHDAPRAVRALARQRVIVDARQGQLRVSPHFYNTEEDVDRLLAELTRGGG